MKLRRQLLWVLIGVLLAGSLAAALGGVWVLRLAVRDNFAGRLRAETATLARWITETPATDPQRFAENAAARLGARVTLIAADGRVVADSAKDREGVRLMDNHLGRPEIQAAMRRGFGESLRLSASTNVEYFYSAHRIEGSGPVAYVRLALPAADISVVQARYAGWLSLVVIGTLLVMAAIAIFGVRAMSKPLERMSATAERIAAGDLALEAAERGPDEVRRLAGSLNRMKRTLLEQVAEAERERSLLSSVVSDMQEGLLLVGPDLRVRLCNRALREIFELPRDPAGALLAEVVRHPAVVRVIERALARGREIRESVTRFPGSGRSFDVHATPLSPELGVIVLFFDITRLERLEGVRREFVANVSHELRTPLTSIKAFVETLLGGGLEDRDNALRFLGIIAKHADRMQALIDDITDLSRIETGAVELELGSVDAAQLAREVVTQLRPQIERHGVTLENELPAPFPVWTDRRRLEQLLTNLIDNAVKFNRRGGRVTIGGTAQGRWTTLFVEDTGIGIPEGARDKIFNRFYRVDPARSREAGGTGLGLAIVKHLMWLHGGRVRVDSELGRGSRFTLEFPTANGRRAAAGRI